MPKEVEPPKGSIGKGAGAAAAAEGLARLAEAVAGEKPKAPIRTGTGRPSREQRRQPDQKNTEKRDTSETSEQVFEAVARGGNPQEHRGKAPEQEGFRDRLRELAKHEGKRSFDEFTVEQKLEKLHAQIDKDIRSGEKIETSTKILAEHLEKVKQMYEPDEQRHGPQARPQELNWTHVAREVNQMAVISGLDARGRILLQEVHQALFNDVVAHPDRYAMITDEAHARDVARTFQYAKMERFHGAKSSAISQQILDAKEEFEAREAELAAEHAKKKKKAKDAAEKEKAQEEAKLEQELSDAEMTDYVNQTIVNQLSTGRPDMLQYMKQFPIQSPRVARFIGERLQMGKSLQQIGLELDALHRSPHQPFVGVEDIEVTRFVTAVAGIENIQGALIPAVAPAVSPADKWWEKILDPAAARGLPANTYINQALLDMAADLMVNPDLAQNSYHLNRMVDALTHMGQGRNPAEITARANQIRPYLEALKQQLATASESDPFNTISLESSVIKRINENRTAALVDQAMKIQRLSQLYPGDTDAGRQAQHIYDQMLQYVQDDRYVNWLRDHTPTEDAFNNEMKKRDELLLRLTKRQTALQMYASVLLYPKGDISQLAEMGSRIGDDGVWTLFTEYGGLTKVAFDIHEQAITNGAWKKGTDDQLRYTNEQRKLVLLSATKEFQNKIHLYKDQFEAYMGRAMTLQDCEDIMFTAHQAHVITQRNVIGVMRGLAPSQAGLEDPHQFVGGDAAEAEAGVFRPMYMEQFRWLLTGAYTQELWNQAAMGAANRFEVRHEVKAMMAGLTPGDARFKQLACYALDVPESYLNRLGEEKVRNFIGDRLRRAFEFDSNAHHQHHTITSIDQMSPKQLERLLTLKKGYDIFERALSMYDYWSSGPMARVVTDVLKDKFGEKALDQYGLGMQLRDACNSVLGATSEHAIEAGNEAVIEVLKKVAKYNPQEILRFHHMHVDESSRAWFNGNLSLIQGVFAGDGGADIQSTGDFLQKLGLYVGHIENQLEIHGFDRVDWSSVTVADLDSKMITINIKDPAGNPGTRSVRMFDHIFGTVNAQGDVTGVLVDKEKFVTMMKSLSSYAGRHDTLHSLLSPQYYDIYRQTEWLYDARLNAIQKDLPEGQLSIAIKLGAHEGLGRGALIARAYGDLATGRLAIDALKMMAASHDPKNFLKFAVEFKNQAINVYGKPWHMRMPMMMIGAYSQMIKSDEIFQWLPLIDGIEHIKNSKMRRLLGYGGLSLGKNELHHLFEEAQLELLSEFHFADPELAEQIEHEAGLIFKGWPPMLNEFPLRWYQGKGLFLLATIIMAQQALTAASEEATGSSGGGGGGHH